MDTSFNLILDWLSSYDVRYGFSDTGIRFSRVSLLPEGPLAADILYVCSPMEAAAAAAENPGCYFICSLEGDPKNDVIDSSRYANLITTAFPGGSRSLFIYLEDRFYVVTSWRSKMQELVMKGSSLQELITLCEPIIGNTIDLSDSAFTLLATTYGIPTDHEISILLRKYGYHPEPTLQIMRKHDRFSSYEMAGRELIVFDQDPDFGPYTQVNRIFRFQNIYFTHAVMICDHKPLSAGLLDLFEMLCDILEIQLKQEWDRRSSESNSSDILIKSIIDGSLSDATEIERRATHFGLSANGRYELTAISTEIDIGVYKTRFIREISELLPTSWVFLHHDLFLVLSPVMTEAKQKSELNSPHLVQFLKRNMASGGSSGVFTGLKLLPLAYKRASLALKYSPANCKGHRYVRQPGDPEDPLICSFTSCFARCIAGESKDGEELWRNSRAGRALIALYENDVAHNNNNLPLLYTYLISGMSASYTAAAYHMHRNNIPYRVGRISTIIDMDLTDEKTRFDLYMSYVMFDIYGP